MRKLKNIRKFNEGLIGRSDPDFDTSKEDLLESKIRDMISNNIEIKNMQYGEWCPECNEGQKEVDSKSMDLATKDIIKLLKKEGLI